MLADSSLPNLFYVLGLPVMSLLAVLAVCFAIYKVLGGPFREG